MHAVDDKRQTTLSGRWVVAGMLALGIVFTAALWIYWYLHVEPFRPLQRTLAAEFPESAPRVEGGQRKLHEDTPRILRITMRVDFDPTTETDRANAFLQRVAAFVRERHGFAGYDRFELHLYHPVPEQEIRQRTYTRPVDELLDGWPGSTEGSHRNERTRDSLRSTPATPGEAEQSPQPASDRTRRNAPTSTRKP